jgi:hypothetical protein
MRLPVKKIRIVFNADSSNANLPLQQSALRKKTDSLAITVKKHLVTKAIYIF